MENKIKILLIGIIIVCGFVGLTTILDILFKQVAFSENRINQLESILDTCFAAWGIDHVYQQYFSGNRMIDNKTCQWHITDKGEAGLIGETDPQIQKVLDHCEEQKKGGYVTFPDLHAHNATHSINNETCEWKPIVKTGPLVIDRGN